MGRSLYNLYTSVVKALLTIEFELGIDAALGFVSSVFLINNDTLDFKGILRTFTK